MFSTLLILFFANSALAEDLKIQKVNVANHIVTVKPISSINATDLIKYEILLDVGADVCELSIKKTTEKEWEFSTEGCNSEKLISKNSRIRLRQKGIKAVAAPEISHSRREGIRYNVSFFYNTANTYKVKGYYSSGLNSGDLDIKGSMSSGAPGLAFGASVPLAGILEIEGGLAYEFARKIHSETGKIGSTSVGDNFGGRDPALSIFSIYGNLKFSTPVDGLYLFGGAVFAFPSKSEAISSKLSVMSGLQGGAGYRITDHLFGEVGIKALQGSYLEKGTIGASDYSKRVDSFSIIGLVGSLKYEF